VLLRPGVRAGLFVPVHAVRRAAVLPVWMGERGTAGGGLWRSFGNAALAGATSAGSAAEKEGGIDARLSGLEVLDGKIGD
jgi:hypothetical protein